MSIQEIMTLGYNRQNKTDKKRIDIKRKVDNSLLKRFYDFGTTELLYKNFSEIFTSDKYIIEIHEIKKR